MFRLLAYTLLLGLQAIHPSRSFSISSSHRLQQHGTFVKNVDSSKMMIMKTTSTTTALSSSQDDVTDITFGGSSSSSSRSSSSNLILYGHPGTRSPLVNWACIELGIKDLKMGDLSQNPHPFGQLPCLRDGPEGDVVVFESGAILSYLLQNYSPPSLTASARGSILSWITWANASLDPICFLETPNGKVYDTGLKNDNKRISQLERILAEQGGVLVPNAPGDAFSLADVAVTSYLLYVVQFFPQVQLAQKWPNMVQYMVDAASRPAYRQAFGGNTQSEVLANLHAQQKAAGSAGGARSGSGKKNFGFF